MDEEIKNITPPAPEEAPKPEPNQEPKVELKSEPKKSLLDNVNVSKSVDFSAHIESLKKNKQVYEEAVKETEKQPKEAPKNSQNQSQTGDQSQNQNSGSKQDDGEKLIDRDAETFTQTFDFVTWMGGFLWKGIPPELLKASKPELEQIKQGWKAYFRESGAVKLPPWFQVAVFIVGVYGFKIYMALEYLKIKQQTEQASRTQQAEEKKDPTSAHEAYKESQFQQQTQEYQFKINTHECMHPACKKQIVLSKKFCSGSCRSKYFNEQKKSKVIKI